MTDVAPQHPRLATPSGLTVEDHGSGRLYLLGPVEAARRLLPAGTWVTTVPFPDRGTLVTVRQGGEELAYGWAPDAQTATRYALGSYFGDPSDPQAAP